MRSKFSEVGVIVLDRQVRLFSNFVTDLLGIEEAKTSLKKLTQMAAVLGCSSAVEVSELVAKSPAGHWILRDSQIREILKLKIK